MKFATYSDGVGTHAAVLEGGKLYPVAGASNVVEIIGDGLEALLERGRAALAGEGVPVESVRIEAPLKPSSMRDSLGFHEHLFNGRGEVAPGHSRLPITYISNSAAVIGPEDVAHISPGCERFDYEMEVAAVIGRAASNVAPAAVREHIIGYTMYIDWSARDVQFEEMALGLGTMKGKDGATTLGPVMVTADEFEPLRDGKGFNVSMKVSINGKPQSNGNWNTISWSYDDVVAFCTRGTTLEPGAVIGSGTVGWGCLHEFNKRDGENFQGWLQVGDVVTFEVDLIGRMDITVGEADVRHPLSSGY